MPKERKATIHKRPVVGLSQKKILARFTVESRPQKLDEKFARQWVWWWRSLPAMLARLDVRLNEGNGTIEIRHPEEYWAIFFRTYSEHVSFQTFLDKIFDAELEERINPGEKWHYLPRKIPIIAAPAEYADIKVSVTLPANLSDKEASAEFLSAYRKAQDDAGIPRVKLNRSNACRNDWSRAFNVLELLDCWSWGWETDNDKLAQVRLLFRQRGLKPGWQ